jgi:hypothetical protein
MACIDLQWIVIQGKPVIIHAISTALISKFGLIDILDLYAKNISSFQCHVFQCLDEKTAL